MHGVDNVGTVPAAVTAYLAVHEFKPDLLISMGTAGGFKARGACIGDVFLATGFANHDRRIPIPVCAAAHGLTCHAPVCGTTNYLPCPLLSTSAGQGPAVGLGS